MLLSEERGGGGERDGEKGGQGKGDRKMASIRTVHSQVFEFSGSKLVFGSNRF